MGCINFETVLNDFYHQISSDAKYFPLFSKALWLGVDSCYSILLSNLEQKTYSHMGPMYVEKFSMSVQHIYIYTPILLQT